MHEGEQLPPAGGGDWDLSLLRSFLAVAEEGHFGRAARRSFVTPSALTQQIQRLEREVGFRLLDRDRTDRPAVLTPAGESLLGEVRKLLEAADRAAAVTAGETDRVRRRLALGFVTTPLGRRTGAFVGRFNERAGWRAMKLVELRVGEQTDAVRRGEVDASLVTAPVDDSSGLVVEAAARSGRLLAVPVGHRLSHRSELRLAEVGGERLVRMVHDAAGAGVPRLQRPDDGRTGGMVSVDTVSELFEAVACRRGVAILPEGWADVRSRADLAYVPLVDVGRSTTVLCTRQDDLSPMVALARQVVADLYAGEGR